MHKETVSRTTERRLLKRREVIQGEKMDSSRMIVLDVYVTVIKCLTLYEWVDAVRREV